MATIYKFIVTSWVQIEDILPFIAAEPGDKAIVNNITREKMVMFEFKEDWESCNVDYIIRPDNVDYIIRPDNVDYIIRPDGGEE